MPEASIWYLLASLIFLQCLQRNWHTVNSKFLSKYYKCFINAKYTLWFAGCELRERNDRCYSWKCKWIFLFGDLLFVTNVCQHVAPIYCRALSAVDIVDSATQLFGFHSEEMKHNNSNSCIFQIIYNIMHRIYSIELKHSHAYTHTPHKYEGSYYARACSLRMMNNWFGKLSFHYEIVPH